MKIWIILIVVLLSLNIAFAEQGTTETYSPGQKFLLNVHVTDLGGEVNNANCSVQIRNETNDVVLDSNLIRQEGGWYNYTYNISKVGEYSCRYNCTLNGRYSAATCDFVIKGDDSMILGALILIPIFISILFLVLSWSLNDEKFQALKIGFAIGAFIPIFWAYNYATIIIAKFYSMPELLNNVGGSASLFGWIFWIFVIIIIITLIWDIVAYVMGKKQKKTGNYDD
jgi:hypothetical protein